MQFAANDLAAAVALRRSLHAHPELSGEEVWTAGAIREFLSRWAPDEFVADLGGHGLAAVYNGGSSGPTVLLRAELDALPIQETGDLSYKSHIAGRGHLCGHDGHSATLALVASSLARLRPSRGRVVLLFQPAEETGQGAARVIEDPRFAALVPDFALALHNLPGLPFGEVSLREGVVNCASRGMRIGLTGRTAHASTPQDGLSPMHAMLRLLDRLPALGPGGRLDEGFRLVTIAHARLGEPAFGIAPGLAEVWATLRTLQDSAMGKLCAEAERVVLEEAGAAGLEFEVRYDDVFHHCLNHSDAVQLLRRAAEAEGATTRAGEPMYASEDFGRFADKAASAMFFLGAGLDHPRLHNPDYDFPDDLIPIGAGVFLNAIREVCG